MTTSPHPPQPPTPDPAGQPAVAPTGSGDSGATGRPRRRRRWWPVWALLILALAGAGGYALVQHAPDLIAHYVVRNYLQGLAVDTSGVETIDIDPINGTIDFGPVTFRGSGAEAGQVGQIGLKVSVGRLFRRQALVESVRVEGIRIDIRQSADGAISINGVPLTQILAEQAAAAEGQSPPAPPPPSAERPASPSAPPGATPPPAAPDRGKWDAGLDRLEIVDSRIVFTDARGGEATLFVDRLDLEGFLAWAPDVPGRFSLEGDINDIHIVANGQATPFARRIEVDVKLDISGIEIAKIERYLGPLGFTASDGRVDLTLAGQGATVFPGGVIEATLAGRGSMADINLAHPLFGAVRLASGTLALPGVKASYEPTGRLTATGDATLDLAASDVRLDDDTEVGFAAVRIGLPDLSAEVEPGRQPKLHIVPQMTVDQLRLGGPDVQGTIGKVEIQLTAFDVLAAEPGTPIVASGLATLTAADLTLPDVEPIRLQADRLAADLSQMHFAFPSGQSLIAGGTTLDANGLALTVAQPAAPSGKPLLPIRLVAASLAGPVPTLLVDNSRDAGTKIKAVSPSLAFQALRLEVPDETGTLTIAAPAAQAREIDIDVSDAATLVVGGRAGLSAERLALGLPLAAAAPPAAIEAAALRLDAGRFVYRQLDNRMQLELAGKVEAGRLRARLPEAGDAPPTVADLTGIRLAIADAAYDQRKAAAETGIDSGTDWRARLDLGLERLEAVLPGTMPMTLTVNALDLDDGAFSSQPAYGFERLVIGRFDAAVTRRPAAPRAAPAPPAATPAAKSPTTRTWPPPGLPAIRIGQIGLIQPSQVQMLDQTVSPPAAVTITVDTLAVQNVDSTRPRSRADVRVKARVDEAPVTVDGWALPFAAKPDFDLRARVGALTLPVVNPFVAPSIGLDITQGRLEADATGAAQAGQLKGELRAAVFDLRFADRPEAGSDRVSQAIGLPLSTIIQLLEDGDGSIRISLPFEGDLLAPAFDYSDMIWDGLFRVLRALVISPFKLVSAGAGLLAASDSGGGASAAEPAPSAAPVLAPVVFPAGDAALAGEAAAAVRRLGQVLKERPRLGLALCGRATAADFAQLAGAVKDAERPVAIARLTPALTRLAQDRTRAVADALTDGAGIARDRLRPCPTPIVDVAEPAPPRVEVRF